MTLVWMFGIIGAIYLAGIMFYFRKIQLTIRLFRKSAFLYKRTWQMKTVVGFGMLGMLFLTFFFLFVMTASSSNGLNKKEAAKIADGFYLNYLPNTIHRLVLWLDYPLVYLLYTFVISLMELMAAFSVSAWYFSRKKTEATLPTTMFMKTALQFHIGTVCKLAFLKTGLKQIRNFAWFVRKRLRGVNQDRNLTRFAIATFLPLLTWYEKKLKFISKDSLINTVIWGDDYDTASQKGYYLAKIRHKEEGYSIMNFVKFILFSSKSSISILAGIFVYAFCITQDNSPTTFDITIMDSPMVPYVFMFVTCLFFTSIFFIPFDMILRGTLQCYAIDSEMFVGDQRFTETDL
jgi:Plasma-membrane choline transporter